MSPFEAAFLALLRSPAAWTAATDPAPKYGCNIPTEWRLSDLQKATPELVSYFTDSFGNMVRIDYGTGHEVTFCAFLYCLARLGAVGQEDRQALVTRVFSSYLTFMRKIQTTYWLEPAGAQEPPCRGSAVGW